MRMADDDPLQTKAEKIVRRLHLSISQAWHRYRHKEVSFNRAPGITEKFFIDMYC